MAIASWSGEVVAESTETVTVDGRVYFPARSVRSGLMRPLESRQGADHYEVIVDGRRCPNAAVRHPLDDSPTAGWISFAHPVSVTGQIPVTESTTKQ